MQCKFQHLCLGQQRLGSEVHIGGSQGFKVMLLLVFYRVFWPCNTFPSVNFYLNAIAHRTHIYQYANKGDLRPVLGLRDNVPFKPFQFSLLPLVITSAYISELSFVYMHAASLTIRLSYNAGRNVCVPWLFFVVPNWNHPECGALQTPP